MQVRKGHIIWLICLALFYLHQLLTNVLSIKITLLDQYLDPFLALPILLGGVLVERHFLWKKSSFRFRGWEVVFLTVLLSVLMEEGFSRWSDQFTHDWWDYVAYGMGGVVVYVGMNR